MGIKDWFAPRKRKDDGGEPLHPGRHTAVAQSGWGNTLSPYRSRTTDVLKTLRSIDDEADALNFLRKVNPDVSMAVWNFIRLSNQGHTMEFEGVNGGKMPGVAKKWESFMSRINAISNAGGDGLIDQLHYSAFMQGAQGCEVEVAATLDDLVDVYPVKPQSIDWEWDEKKQRWIAYQRQAMKKVSLEGANFFWVPTDPDIDDPRGNLVMGSVLQAIDFQMQMLQDLQAVIHHQGWPKRTFKLVTETVMKNMPSSVKGDQKKQKEWVAARIQELKDALRDMRPDDDFVFTDDIEIDAANGTEATRSLDIRALFEGIDVQTMSGLKQLAVFLNRVGGSGTTEAWSSVQFRVFTSGIKSIQRGSKRLMEGIARLWLRTQGIQAVPKFTHNTIDWQSEMDKANVKLAWQQYWAIAQLMNWIPADEAASQAMGVGGAVSDKPSENIRASFGIGGELGEDGGIGASALRVVRTEANRTTQLDGDSAQVRGGTKHRQ
jgi:hypothetical protein